MKNKLLSLLLVLILVLTYGTISVSAIPGDESDDGKSFIIDDYNRTVDRDPRVSTKKDGVIFWKSQNEYIKDKEIPIVDGALDLKYNALGWYAMGVAMDTTKYDYLCLRIKGSKGGEEDKMTLKFGDADYEDIDVSGNTLSAFTTADGGHPVITKEFTTIVIDMNKSDIIAESTQKKITMLKNFLGIHFNFMEEGEIFIDQIWLTTDPEAPMPEGETLKAEVTTKGEETTAAAEEDTTNADNDADNDTTVAVTEAADSVTESKPLDAKTIFIIFLAVVLVILVIIFIIYFAGKNKNAALEEKSEESKDKNKEEDSKEE